MRADIRTPWQAVEFGCLCCMAIMAISIFIAAAWRFYPTSPNLHGLGGETMWNHVA